MTLRDRAAQCAKWLEDYSFKQSCAGKAYPNDNIFSDSAQVIRALLAFPAPAGAEGRVLVPKEPTKEMLVAGAKAMAGPSPKGPQYCNGVPRIYAAMLGASPAQAEEATTTCPVCRGDCSLSAYPVPNCPRPRATPPAEAREVVEEARLPDEETWLRNLRCPKCACYGYEVGCGTDCEFRSKDWPAEYRALTAAPEVRG
jgi:hypothetical protein